jgi:hypothetical protein
MRDTGKSFRQPEIGEFRLWVNDRYAAGVRSEPFGAHVTIASLDGTNRHDWRDMQRIKNDLCGEQFDAVELYPAEDRLVDTSNTFHLWIFFDRLPFGFVNRAVAEGVEKIPNCPQRQTPFGEDRPADCIDLSKCETLAQAMAALPMLFQPESLAG